MEHSSANTGLLDGDPLAHNAWSTLLSKLSSWLPPPKVLELQSLYDSYKEGEVEKEKFLIQLRSVVGDEFLHSIIQEIRG
ncbi:hypothetical protein FXO37_31314 [Capsicum annuum]|nr:hypothetical protein FXO37_31314 [Capsicum annuum]